MLNELGSIWSYFHLFNLSDEENWPVQGRLQHFPLGMRMEVVSEGGGFSLVNAVYHFFMCANFNRFQNMLEFHALCSLLLQILNMTITLC